MPDLLKIKRMGKKNSKLKIPYKCIKANTSAICQNIMLHIPPTKILIFLTPKKKRQKKDKSHTKESTVQKMGF